MKLCRFTTNDGTAALGVVVDDAVYRIDQIESVWSSLADFLRWTAGRAGVEQALRAAVRGQPAAASWHDLSATPEAGSPRLLAPLDRQEVWAAGVTYLRSRAAREEESKGSGIYDRVYDAQRPELFLKATPSRVVGPHGPVRIRVDARWNVPEPELALVLNPALEIVGYTVGNDMSSRDIEGENPLYLPQAKVYRECCALGPAITLAAELPAAANTPIQLLIERDGRELWSGETTTGQMKRTFADLITYLGRDNIFPDGVILLTGTGLVPPDNITLHAGDSVTITIDGIGALRNHVVQG